MLHYIIGRLFGVGLFSFRNKPFSMMLKFCYILLRLLHDYSMSINFVVGKLN